MRAGVDIGGTFTDLVLSEGGGLTIHKLLSTPETPERAMLAGLEALAPGGITALQAVAHGSTVATNAILERKGARAALLTTAGFRDLLFIGRQDRPQLYDIHPRIPPPLIPRERCYEVPERLDHRGEVLLELDMAALDGVLDEVAAQGCDAIGVCFLFSYVNAAHERLVKQRILERGIVAEDWQVVLSSEALPEFREYERASTVALEAYVRPVMSRYIGVLESRLPRSLPLRIMKSDGGVMRAGRVRQQAIHTALSGTGGRRDGRLASGAGGGLRQNHHAGHGRHLHRCRLGGRPAVATSRVVDRRLAIAPAHAGYRDHRRGRRFHRAGGCRRSAARGTRVGRRRPGTSRIWTRRLNGPRSVMPMPCWVGWTRSMCWAAR